MFTPRNIRERELKLEEIESEKKKVVDKFLAEWRVDKEAKWNITQTLYGLCTNYSMGNAAMNTLDLFTIVDVNVKDNQIIVSVPPVVRFKNGDPKWCLDLNEFAHNCKKV